MNDIDDTELQALRERFDTVLWPTEDKRTSDRLVEALDGLDRDRVERLLDVMWDITQEARDDATERTWERSETPEGRAQRAAMVEMIQRRRDGLKGMGPLWLAEREREAAAAQVAS
jgi:hypothetical protein